jgi:hypothetical protein
VYTAEKQIAAGEQAMIQVVAVATSAPQSWATSR